MERSFLQSLRLVYCYAPEDREWRDEIDLHLENVKRNCHITDTLDGVLQWDWEQKERPFAFLKENDLVLLLVSVHFNTSDPVAQLDLCTRLEALRWSGGCFVITLLLETVAWDGTPYGAATLLPSDGRSLLAWQNRQSAFQNIESGIFTSIEDLWFARGEWLQNEARDYEKAIKAYEEALRMNTYKIGAWYGKGNALLELKQYEEALDAYEKALWIDSAFSWAWYAKGRALVGLNLYNEALGAYDEALHIIPSNHHFWYWKGEALKALGRKGEARQAKEMARQLGWR